MNNDIHGFRGIGLFLVLQHFDAEAAAKEGPVSWEPSFGKEP
jgi:hypothetical protein